MKLKVYVAGKVSKESVFGTHYWRDGFCRELEKMSGQTIINLDPTKPDGELDIDQTNPMFVFGHDCYLISQSDIVIVNLTDDISVGGSQEMLIAKYFGKSLIGVAPKGGKFRPDKKELFGKTLENYLDPFVYSTCDTVVEDIKEAAEFIKNEFVTNSLKPKNIKIIDESLEYYLNSLKT